METGKCFEGFLKFRTLRCAGQEFVPSKSGKYFEDLEGISLGKIADVTTEKYKSVQEFVDQRTQHAISCLMDEMLVKLPDHKFKQAERTHKFGHFTKETILPSAKYRGVKLRKQNTPLSYIYIEYVTIKSNTTKPGQIIKIFEGDLSNQENLKQIEVDLIAGKEIKVAVNERFYGKNVFIVSENSDVTMFNSRLYSHNACNYEGECYNEMYYSYGYPYAMITGFDGEKHSSKTFGIKVEYSIRCEKELLLCRLAQECKNAILYRAGVEILKEWLSGDRLTFVSIYSEDWAKEKVVEWAKLADYYMDACVDGLSDYLTKLDAICLPCEGNRMVKIMP